MADESPIHDDEDVVLFPSVAVHASTNPTLLQIAVHGWIFEPEYTSIRRNLLLAAFCRSLKLLDEECDTELFKHRARYFLVDNERGKRIAFSVTNIRSVSELSGTEGHFRGAVQIPLSSSDASTTTPLTVTVSAGSRRFQGDVFAIKQGGITVISDIDDTIKISQVTDLNQLMRNTFLRPFTPTPGIVPLYRNLASQGALFHYISATPWQLYPPLAEFMRESGLPGGTFHLKEFRWKDSRFFDLLLAPQKFKTELILSRLALAPQRRFILIGDSGEQDPEIYGEIARLSPQHDIRILIRELTESPVTASRRERAFASLPADLWRVVPEGEFAQTAVTETLTRFGVE